MIFLLKRFYKTSNVRYWKDRVSKFGKRAVLDISHTEDEYNKITSLQKKEIYPHLKKALKGNEETVLDFGCGPGRFTADLSKMIKGQAVGIDVVPKLIEVAPQSPNVDYKVFDGIKIPLPNKSIDAVWICLVLGGIEDLKLTIKEIKRVLKPRGLIFMVENTTSQKDGQRWYYRPIEFYKDLFGTPLKHVHDYLDVGERISIFTGRLK